MSLPKSVAHWGDPIAIAAVAAGLYIACRSLPVSNTELALILSATITVVLCIFELSRAPWKETARPNIPLPAILRRAAIEWLGTMAQIGLVLFAWYLFPEFHRGHFHPLIEAAPFVLPLAPLVTGLCILFTEWRLGPEDDSTWHFGLLVIGRWREINWLLVRDGLLGLMMKGFLLPINFCWLISLMSVFRGKELHILDGAWPYAIGIVDSIVLALLAVAIIPGYLFGARLFDTQTRKVDHSWFGWVIVLSAYSPINDSINQAWLNYHPYHTAQWMYPWVLKLQDMPIAFYAAGGLIILFEVVHYWGEALFGIRSSNLMNRGIITNGPYRFFKHPVYGVKCVAWLFIWMPFLMGGTILQDIRLTILWCGHSFIFGMRSWIEERLLSTDPDYVAYALWIDQHGLLAWLGKRAPFMRFRWRLEHWQRLRAEGRLD